MSMLPVKGCEVSERHSAATTACDGLRRAIGGSRSAWRAEAQRAASGVAGCRRLLSRGCVRLAHGVGSQAGIAGNDTGRVGMWETAFEHTRMADCLDRRGKPRVQFRWDKCSGVLGVLGVACEAGESSYELRVRTATTRFRSRFDRDLPLLTTSSVWYRLKRAYGCGTRPRPRARPAWTHASPTDLRSYTPLSLL